MKSAWLVLLIWLVSAPWAHAQERFVRVEPVPDDATVTFYDYSLPKGQLQAREVRLGAKTGQVEVLVQREGYRDEHRTLKLLTQQAVAPNLWEFSIELVPKTLAGHLAHLFRARPVLSWGAVSTLLLLGAVVGWHQRQRFVRARAQVEQEKTELRQRLDEVNPDLTGRTIGDYQVISKLGEGAFAQVYRVRHNEFGDEGALKILKPDILDHESLMRFDQEASIIQQLSHPSLVRLDALGSYLNRPYLVMELLQGGSLDELLKKGALPVSGAIEMFKKIAEGVAYAHSRRIVHRDLKPSNILLSDGGPRIVDFGVARLTDRTRMTRTGETLGTPCYMAPEQLCGTADHRADLYSLGVILFEMLTGEVPFYGESVHEIITGHLVKPVPSASNLNPSVPVAVDRLLERMMAKDVEERFQSLDEVLEALNGLSIGQGSQ